MGSRERKIAAGAAVAIILKCGTVVGEARNDGLKDLELFGSQIRPSGP
jgi:hypothetical protein